MSHRQFLAVARASVRTGRPASPFQLLTLCGMDVAKLITLVQNYEELYNMRHAQYFNITRRDNCWEEIGSIMNETGT